MSTNRRFSVNQKLAESRLGTLDEAAKCDETMQNLKRGRSRLKVGGLGGSEAQLFEFQEVGSEEPRTVRIAALKLDEALSFLRLHEPDFQIKRVENLGLILMVSGSPVD